MDKKYVYTFGSGAAEGNKEMKILLGGKGANLAEMNLIGLSVPPGFTISTEACINYFDLGKKQVLEILTEQVLKGVENIEKLTGKRFGDAKNPLLLSVRSGARTSMPGMMDTVLNLGLNLKVVKGMAESNQNPRLAWDSYRRFLQMYGSVVLGLKPVFKDDMDPFEVIIDKIKENKKVELDTDLEIEDLILMTEKFKVIIEERTGHVIPEDPYEQLHGSIIAVFDSWMGERAFQYRKINNIPHDWGTAVNVQAMVFGNTGKESATGVAFTRDPATGENVFVGEYLINAQGEDVVAGTRTPQQISIAGSKNWAKLAGIKEVDRKKDYPSLEEVMPTMYRELALARTILEDHYRDMQDLEFTIEKGKLWILQTRNGKRTGEAMVRIAMDMWKEGIITDKDALMRVEAEKLQELLIPVFEQNELAKAIKIAQGLPASPGGASGQIVFFANDAAEWLEEKKAVILVRIETSPEDIKGMDSAKGILTSRGGMTSHAAVVARGMGKPCVSGAGSLQINYNKRTLTVEGKKYKEGDWISLDGMTGNVYEGKIPTIEAKIGGYFNRLMKLADQHAKLFVMANADTPRDAQTAIDFGAKGIGLCRTEHMFFKDERIKLVREMILAHNEDERKTALDKLLPVQRKDFVEIFEIMHDKPVTVRLLDPPLHEFLPEDEEGMKVMAEDMGYSFEEVKEKVRILHEVNPMLGHRGCRLANTYPEISEMQTRAILDAALILSERGVHVYPEIMVPLTSVGNELRLQLSIIRKTAELLFVERGQEVKYKVGTMVEIPRACLIAERISPDVDFFSFGTNDLTQMTFGYSRDDISKFLPIYLKKGILKNDPFQTIDQKGVGELVKVGTAKGKRGNPELKVGICGEHGGDPESIRFFHDANLNYVSCSPYRVPIARLVTAQANIAKPNKSKLNTVKEDNFVEA